MLWMRVSTTFYRRAALMVRDLAAGETVLDPAPASIAPLEPGELAAYLRFRPDQSAEVIHQRLTKGHAAFVARVGDRIVHAAWVASGRAYVPYLRRDILLERDELLMYDSYTLAEFRETGIARARQMHVFREYRKRGFRRFVAVVARENVVGRRAVEAAGYRPDARYACVRLGPLDRCRQVWSDGTAVPELRRPVSR